MTLSIQNPFTSQEVTYNAFSRQLETLKDKIKKKEASESDFFKEVHRMASAEDTPYPQQFDGQLNKQVVEIRQLLQKNSSRNGNSSEKKYKEIENELNTLVQRGNDQLNPLIRKGDVRISEQCENLGRLIRMLPSNTLVPKEITNKLLRLGDILQKSEAKSPSIELKVFPPED